MNLKILKIKKYFFNKGIRYFSIFSFLLGLIFLFFLSKMNFDLRIFGDNLKGILIITSIVTFTLFLLVSYQLVKLIRLRKKKVFGSKLTLRLVIFFSIIAILPGIVIYSLSLQFFTRSIETWFDVRVDNALESGISFSRLNLESGLKDLRQISDTMSLSLSEVSDEMLITQLNVLREQVGIFEATLFSEDGDIIAFSSEDSSRLLPELISPSILRQVKMLKPYAALEEIGEFGLQLRTTVPVNLSNGGMSILNIVQPVDERIAKDAILITDAYSDYQELSLSKESIKLLYKITLSLSLALSLLTVFLLSIMFSKELASPLKLLDKATKAVREGDFSKLQPITSDDEFGILTESFNNMTRELAQAEESEKKIQTALISAKEYLENVLANLSAGVVSLDESFNLVSANNSAAKILGGLDSEKKLNPISAIKSNSLWESKIISEAFENFTNQKKTFWQKQIEISTKTRKIVLLINGSTLTSSINPGYVLIFDDISNILQAQRYAAWGEVGRRLAHEIKNPLTPIQLSAERIQHRIHDSLNEKEAEFLVKSVNTIVNQVSALKEMVDAFNSYAKAPDSTFVRLNFTDLIKEILILYSASNSRIERNLTKDNIEIFGNGAQLRQVIHNIFQNAEYAVSSQKNPKITIKLTKKNRLIILSIKDNGKGFPDEIISRAFEPYITTKSKGTGLGLAIAKKIIEEHKGDIKIYNNKDYGGTVEINFPIFKEVI